MLMWHSAVLSFVLAIVQDLKEALLYPHKSTSLL